VDPASLTGLPALISAPRLGPYLAACDSGVYQAVRLYTWNVEVAAAFWGCVHVLEVGMRNAMHGQLVSRFSRDDWWDAPEVRLHNVTQGQLQTARRSADRTAGKARRLLVPDDVVASLSFGFWSGLLGPGGPFQYETQFWQPALRKAFPGHAGSRKSLHKEVDSIRLFRNRLAHHEPVFARHLAADLATILHVAQHISPDLREYIDSHNTVHEALARRERAVSRAYATRFRPQPPPAR